MAPGRCARRVDAQPGETVLDLAAGTGTSSEPFADAGVDVVPADFSLGMLRVGNRRRPDLAFTAADAMRLPFADDSFDAVTMSFGLRNVADAGAGPARVPAGDPARRPARGLRVQPAGQRGRSGRSTPSTSCGRCRRSPAGSAPTPSPTSTWPSRSRPGPTSARSPRVVEGAGWSDVEWRNLTGGIVALHRAVKAG